jgi:hypothetical protein
MPTYEELRSYFDSNEVLGSIARAAANVPIVQGFTLSTNRLWEFLYDREDQLVTGDVPDDLYLIEAFNMRLPWMLGNRYQGYRRRDLYRQVHDFEKHRKGINKRWLPVTLTIVYRPQRPPGADYSPNVSGERENDESALRRLLAIVAEAPIRVGVEERRPARLAVGGGGRIGRADRSFGTLGGILRDPATGKSYGVTCGHVAGAGDTILDDRSAVIGKCVYDIHRVSLQSGAVCDPVLLAMPNPSPGNGPAVNMLDCALIDLTCPTTTAAIGGIASALTPGQNVVMRGASTNISRHKLGSLCLSYAFSDGGKEYCFRDTIELLPQPRGPFGGIVGDYTAKVPMKGDSGAWVITDDQPGLWACMFFGEDGDRGFAIRSSWIKNWADNSAGRPLSL